MSDWYVTFAQKQALIKKPAKARRPYLGCCVDCPGQQGREEARAGAISAGRAVLKAVADDIRAELLESGPLPEGWERDTYVSLIDVDEWLSQVVIHGPWREGRHD